MIYYFLIFVIFLLVAQFAISMLPFLLPLCLIFFVISLFKKPNVRVYTHTYTFPDSPFGPANGTSPRTGGNLLTRAPREDSIDAEFTEYSEPIEER